MTKQQTVNTGRRSDYSLIGLVKQHGSNGSKSNTAEIYNCDAKMPLVCFNWKCYNNLADEKASSKHFKKLFGWKWRRFNIGKWILKSFIRNQMFYLQNNVHYQVYQIVMDGVIRKKAPEIMFLPRIECKNCNWIVTSNEIHHNLNAKQSVKFTRFNEFCHWNFFIQIPEQHWLKW